MVNQNPQPECYTTRHSFSAGATDGTSSTQQILTNQAHNEELRIYAVSFNLYDANGTPITVAQEDFTITILAGPNSVPSKSFRADSIARARDRTLTLSAPVLILHRQPLQVQVNYVGGTNLAAATIVKITLNGEMYLQEYFG